MSRVNFSDGVLLGEVEQVCLVCEDVFSSPLDAAQHAQLSRHRTRLAETHYVVQFPGQRVRKIKKWYFCELCKVPISSNNQIIFHILSDKHKQRRNSSYNEEPVMYGYMLRLPLPEYHLIVFSPDLRLGEKSWHGIVGNICCVVCEQAFENDRCWNTHIKSVSHLMKLITLKTYTGPQKELFRKVSGDLIQCLTCNEAFSHTDYTLHFGSKRHYSIYTKCAEDYAKVTAQNSNVLAKELKKDFELVSLCRPYEETKNYFEWGNVNNNESEEKSEQNLKKRTDLELENNLKKVTGLEHENNLKKGTDLKLEKSIKKGTDLKLERNIKKGTDLKLEKNIITGTDLKLEKNIKKGTDLKLEKNIKTGTDLKLEKNIKKGTDLKLEKNIKKETDLEPENNLKKGTDLEHENNNEDSKSNSTLEILNNQDTHPVFEMKNKQTSDVNIDNMSLEELASYHDIRIRKKCIHCSYCKIDIPRTLQRLREHVFGKNHKAILSKVAPKSAHVNIPYIPMGSQAQSKTADKCAPPDQGFAPPSKTFIAFISSAIELCRTQKIIINESICVDTVSFHFSEDFGFGLGYCYACGVIIRIPDHFNKVSHLYRVHTPSVLRMEKEFLREICHDTYHCGFCNVVFRGWNEVRLHLESSEHSCQKAEAADALAKFLPVVRRRLSRLPRQRNKSSAVIFGHIFL